jgi:hypothetical protein
VGQGARTCAVLAAPVQAVQPLLPGSHPDRARLHPDRARLQCSLRHRTPRPRSRAAALNQSHAAQQLCPAMAAPASPPTPRRPPAAQARSSGASLRDSSPRIRRGYRSDPEDPPLHMQPPPDALVASPLPQGGQGAASAGGAAHWWASTRCAHCLCTQQAETCEAEAGVSQLLSGRSCARGGRETAGWRLRARRRMARGCWVARWAPAWRACRARQARRTAASRRPWRRRMRQRAAWGWAGGKGGEAGRRGGPASQPNMLFMHNSTSHLHENVAPMLCVLAGGTRARAEGWRALCTAEGLARPQGAFSIRSAARSCSQFSTMTSCRARVSRKAGGFCALRLGLCARRARGQRLWTGSGEQRFRAPLGRLAVSQRVKVSACEGGGPLKAGAVVPLEP